MNVKRIIWKTRILFSLVFFLFAGSSLPGASPQQISAASALHEYEIKAAFIYQFAQFVEWPGETLSGSDHFIFCVVGPNPFGRIMEAFEKEQVQGKNVRVRYHEKIKDADACHVIFVSSSLGNKIDNVLEETAGRPLLSVGETYGFIEKGGIISFVREGAKIRFEINQQSASRAGLRISSKLLNLAQKVIARENRDVPA